MINNEAATGSGNHRLIMNNRNQATVTGVSDVISFDSGTVLLDTNQGTMKFTGEGLHVKELTLEKGEVELEGRVDQIQYSTRQQSAKEAGSFVSRLFR